MLYAYNDPTDSRAVKVRYRLLAAIGDFRHIQPSNYLCRHSLAVGRYYLGVPKSEFGFGFHCVDDYALIYYYVRFSNKGFKPSPIRYRKNANGLLLSRPKRHHNMSTTKTECHLQSSTLVAVMHYRINAKKPGLLYGTITCGYDEN